MHNTSARPQRTESQIVFSATGILLRMLVVFFGLAFLTSPAFAQESKPIEPCPATPTTLGSQTPGATSPTERPPTSETLIDSTIPDDEPVLKLLEPYRAKVNELSVVIGTLEGDLRKGRVGGGSLGNFVVDGLRAEASRRLGRPVVLTITNNGGLRKNSIAAGPLHVSDIFELLPFENALIVVDLTGEQLLKLLKGAVNSGDAQSGALVTYKLKADERPDFVGASFMDEKGTERPIDPNAVYSAVTIDYLYGLSSGNYAILKEGKNMKPVGVTMRDALLSYVKTETANKRPLRSKLDGRFKQVGTEVNEAAPK